MDTKPRKRYWFYAKRYGYGWGLPASWEGWLVLTGYVGGAVGGVALFPPDRAMGGYVIFLTVITLLLMAACYLKGEPARWRWGDTSDLDGPGAPAGRREPGRVGLLLLHLLLGPLLLGIAVFFRFHPPAEINGVYGYRTAVSMRSQAAWDEAQRYSADVMIVAAGAVVVCQILCGLTMKPSLSLVVSTLLLLGAVFATLPITETHLNRMFDAQGRPIGGHVVPAAMP